MGFFQTAVIRARQVDVALGYVVESASAARATGAARIAAAAEEGSPRDAVFVLRDLVVDRVGVAPDLAGLLIHQRLNTRHGGSGNRGSAQPGPGVRGTAARSRSVRGLARVRPANGFEVPPNT